VVANKGLEKVQAYLTRSPRTDGLMSPTMETKVTLVLYFWVRAECSIIML